MSCLDERLLPDLVQADVPWAVLSQQATLVLAGAALPGRMRPAICSGEQSRQSCSLIQATRSGRLMSGHGAASFVLFGPGSRIWSCGGAAPGQSLYGFGQDTWYCFGNSSHGCNSFDHDAFFRSQMAMGHVGSLLVACCLTLPSLPESRPVPFTCSPPERAGHWP